MIDQKDLRRITIRNAHPGRRTRAVHDLLEGAGSITVKYASVKRGTAQTSIARQEGHQDPGAAVGAAQAAGAQGSLREAGRAVA